MKPLFPPPPLSTLPNIAVTHQQWAGVLCAHKWLPKKKKKKTSTFFLFFPHLLFIFSPLSANSWRKVCFFSLPAPTTHPPRSDARSRTTNKTEPSLQTAKAHFSILGESLSVCSLPHISRMEPPDTGLCQLDWNKELGAGGAAVAQWNLLLLLLLLFLPLHPLLLTWPSFPWDATHNQKDWKKNTPKSTSTLQL